MYIQSLLCGTLCMVLAACLECPVVTILEPECFVDGDIASSSSVSSHCTFELSIYEDCPKDVPLAQFKDAVIADCAGMLNSENGSFSLTEQLNAEDESESNSFVCADFVSTEESATHYGVIRTENINEFPPQATDIALAQTIVVPETATGEILEFSYTDNDYEEYLTLQFEENFESSGVFALSEKSIDRKNGTITYSLSVIGALDYEKTQFYDLTAIFTSEDSRGNASSTTQTFLISVTDVGDNPPTFTNGSPYVDLEEQSDNPEVFVCSAVDGDISVNNNIIFSILSGNEDQYFTIDPQTGTITTVKLVDREILESKYFVLKIEALEIDGDSQPVPEPNSATQNLDINIVDVNDNIPTFNSKIYTVSTVEHDLSTDGTLILKDLNILIIDLDEGFAGRYNITSDNPNVIVYPDAGAKQTEVTISIQPSEEFNFETNIDAIVSVMLTAVELADSSHTSTAVLRITVVDVNDNFPVFEPIQYTASPAEDLAPGSNITRVQATDSDGSVEFNTESIVYSLEDCDTLRIDEYTGTITLSFGKNLDYETLPEFECSITATDMEGSSENSLQTTIPLFITVLDINDEKPVFKSIENYVTLKENAPIGTVVTEFQVSDVDTNSVLEVSLTFPDQDSQVASWFTVEFDDQINSGTILTQNLLNHEIASEVSVKVMITDTNTDAEGMASNSEIVLVSIDNVNDETPFFVEDYSCETVEEERAIGATAFEVIAKDNDPGDTIVYSISNNEYLSIDSQTGVVAFAARIDRESVEKFDVQISATDTADHVETVFVYVSVLDINDQIPTNDGIIFGDFLATNVQGDVVATFEFSDADSDDTLMFYDNGDFKWSDGLDLTDPFVIKNIDDRSGQIILNTSPKGVSGYCQFSITAQDEAGHTAEASVQIYAITEEYIVEFTFNNQIESVRNAQKQIEETFSTVFGYTCVTDYIEQSKDESNNVIEGYTLYKAHFIDVLNEQLIPVQTIERLGLDGTVVVDLNEQLYPLVLECIGTCSSVTLVPDKKTVRNLKLSLAVITLSLSITIILLVVLFGKKITRQRLQLKALSAGSATKHNMNKLDNQHLQVPGSNLYIAEGTNPIWNLNDNDLNFGSDRDSISSGGSVLVGVEEDTNFSYANKTITSDSREYPVQLSKRSLSVCTEESA